MKQYKIQNQNPKISHACVLPCIKNGTLSLTLTKENRSIMDCTLYRKAKRHNLQIICFVLLLHSPNDQKLAKY